MPGKSARMLVIRPITLEDLDQLVALAHQTGYGLTTLPRDPDLLRNRVLDSVLGMWTRRDPLGYVDAMDLYAYVGNRPVTET